MNIDLIVFIVLMALGYGFGQLAERRHYQSILKREADTLAVPAMTLKTLPPQLHDCSVALVSGNVVISVDFFKRFLSSLRNLVGGRVKSYESLLDRARREAILRMKEQAISQGAKVIANVRIETSSISKNSRGKQSVGSIEVLAYGTAIVPGKLIRGSRA
jgi:uncharacterized protein YbjQ (UPF0145 family)